MALATRSSFRTLKAIRGAHSFCKHATSAGSSSDRVSSLWDEHRLTADQLHFRALATDFAKKELLPNAAQWDRDKYFPVEVLRKAAGLGFGGMFCAEDVGGSRLNRVDGAVIFEALAYGDVIFVAFPMFLSICSLIFSNSVVCRYGNDQQRNHWLPKLIQMELFSSYCLTEPSSGSDAASLQTTARQAHGSSDYILNGSKAFISGGSVSDLYLVMARTGALGPKGISCFLLEKGMPGLSFGRPEDKLGWRSQPTTSVVMEEVRVPSANMLGREGQGFAIAMAGLDGGRINIASCSCGGAQFCLDTAQEYASTRKQFGKAITEFQSTQFKLADMQTALHASRLMVSNAAAALDAGSPKASACAAMAKRFATDACFNIANDALQLHGGYGYLKDYPVERYLRDLRVHTILEGTNEIMRVVLFRHMLQQP
ncbi:isobutyryl-CoA dehydrogenase, mitochondrial isoform X1 [Selaginella moellendorffii]|uniref:isobutyryl-CoA dehydrogenase, mitochondrial isoform X1 n=1 Tax=Selaginella moellendorffii TaxID=88036 RepID=UPI000D1C81C0|nr:isobutyryl-CoA dehydrogenase, mitochondrial isoform X1 [Selaginella moellendorffii]|eukprot:XP_024528108.1 isobutyryl-CoA dehydrogenase, mitochondrial isoform X1 [Selaginella moellendorffii]